MASVSCYYIIRTCRLPLPVCFLSSSPALRFSPTLNLLPITSHREAGSASDEQRRSLNRLRVFRDRLPNRSRSHESFALRSYRPVFTLLSKQVNLLSFLSCPALRDADRGGELHSIHSGSTGLVLKEALIHSPKESSHGGSEDPKDSDHVDVVCMQGL